MNNSEISIKIDVNSKIIQDALKRLKKQLSFGKNNIVRRVINGFCGALDWLMDSPNVERAIWVVILLSIIYFVPVIITIINR